MAGGNGTPSFFILLSLPHVTLQNLRRGRERWSPFPSALQSSHFIRDAYLSDTRLLLSIKIQTLRCVGTEWLLERAAI